ncbi:MAG: amino acid ABC transporter permease [Candidatus Thorarchaeota archaeon]|nr:amino acid ABC transporter permease [Candidatus Thorarchaeota archaeon]
MEIIASDELVPQTGHTQGRLRLTQAYSALKRTHQYIVFGIMLVSVFILVQILYPDYYGQFVSGVAMTMGLYVFALAFGFVLGLVLAIVRVYGNPIASRISTAYIEIIRGTPVVTQMLLIALAPHALRDLMLAMGYGVWDVRVFLAALCLGLNSAAYQAEYLRSAITATGSGQMLAARSLGMSRAASIQYIILPQSLRRVIPAWMNEATYLPKVTTAAYIVSVEEVFAWAKFVTSRVFLPLQVYVTVALFFIAVIMLITALLEQVHGATRVPGL